MDERLSRLSEAGLRITEDLDFSAVPQGAADNARSLTSSRYGAITVAIGPALANAKGVHTWTSCLSSSPVARQVRVGFPR